jgi:hypothetical protein
MDAGAKCSRNNGIELISTNELSKLRLCALFTKLRNVSSSTFLNSGIDKSTHHRMPPNIVVCRPVDWRLEIGAGTTVRKSQIYIRLYQTIGIV